MGALRHEAVPSRDLRVGDCVTELDDREEWFTVTGTTGRTFTIRADNGTEVTLGRDRGLVLRRSRDSWEGDNR